MEVCLLRVNLAVSSQCCYRYRHERPVYTSGTPSMALTQ